MVRVEIEGIAIDAANRSPVVLLRGGDGGVLPIVVGVFEAQSILFVLEGAVFDRPLTHDLIRNLIGETGYSFRRLEIYGIRDGIYYAEMVLEREGNEKKIDCRPSDGIALALRFDAPVLAEASLLKKIEIVKYSEGAGKFVKADRRGGPIGRKEAEDLRKAIENMKAGEFWEEMKKE